MRTRIQQDVFGILQGPEGARLRAIAALGNQNHRTARAVERIRTHYSKPLRVEELAEMTGMAVSTFHRHFRALTSMSPVQYQKQMRLQAARGRVMTEDIDAASAAFAVGYESPKCPSLTVTANRDKADYIVRFDRDEPSPITPFVKGNKAAVFDRNEDLVYSSSSRYLSGAVKGVCSALLKIPASRGN